MSVEECGFEVDLARGGVGSGVNLELGGLSNKLKFVPSNTSLKIRHLHPSNELALRLGFGEKLSFGWNSNKVRATRGLLTIRRMLTMQQDAELLISKHMKLGRLQIRQRIPQGRWELVPSPELKLSLPPVQRGKFTEESDLTYDLLTSRGSLDHRITYDFIKLGFRASCLSNAHGLPLLIPFTRLMSYPCLINASMNSNKMALEASLSANLKKPWLRSLGVDYSENFGTVLSYEAELATRVKLESAVSLRKKELWVALEVSPSSESMIKLTAEATTSSLWSKPALLLGMRFEP